MMGYDVVWLLDGWMDGGGIGWDMMGYGCWVDGWMDGWMGGGRMD